MTADYTSVTTWIHKKRFTGYITDIKINWCRIAVSKLNLKEKVMID